MACIHDLLPPFLPLYLAAIRQPVILRDYALAAIAGIWCADGILLLAVPRFIVTHLRNTIAESPTILHWEWLAVAGGGLLLFLGQDLVYGPLWIFTAGGMIAKGLFLSMGPAAWRTQVLEWCLTREVVDYRFIGLGLCTLAVLLLHALGWIGQSY